MDISNLYYINDNDFYYLFEEGKLYFVKDISLNPDTAKIAVDSHPVYSTNHVIYYNFSPYSKLVSFPDQLRSIYDGYISKNSFANPDQTLGSWCKYNSDLKSYYLKFSFVFNTQKDYSHLATCQHLTSFFNPINAENYHYANKSKNNVCSHPTVIKNNEGKISYCSMIMDHPANCPLYQEDKKLISRYNVKSKNSPNVYVFSSYVSRFLDQVHIFVENSETKDPIFNVKLSDLNDVSYDKILFEAEFLMQEALSAYPLTFFSIEKDETDTSIPVSISKKKSYISSLV